VNTNLDELRSSLTDIGFARSSAESMHASASSVFASWDEFAASYGDLALDLYMADQGHYRRRRYAVYQLNAEAVLRAEHQPHYQSTKYNWLNGDVERWFEPIAEHVAGGATLHAILQLCYAVFAPLRPEIKTWHTEVHQFRIEATVGVEGQPTPEGVHRDGVDFVLVLLVKRENIVAGTTTLHAPGGEQISAFTLTEPGDCVWLDDQRLFHGVTPVQAADPTKPAYRDVLVVTIKSMPANPL
jgi:hypothetical protein